MARGDGALTRVYVRAWGARGRPSVFFVVGCDLWHMNDLCAPPAPRNLRCFGVARCTVRTLKKGMTLGLPRGARARRRRVAGLRPALPLAWVGFPDLFFGPTKVTKPKKRGRQ